MPADNHDVELWLRNGRMYRRGLDKRQPGPPRPAKTVASTRVTSEHSSSLANRAYPRACDPSPLALSVASNVVCPIHAEPAHAIESTRP